MRQLNTEALLPAYAYLYDPMLCTHICPDRGRQSCTPMAAAVSLQTGARKNRQPRDVLQAPSLHRPATTRTGPWRRRRATTRARYAHGTTRTRRGESASSTIASRVRLAASAVCSRAVLIKVRCAEPCTTYRLVVCSLLEKVNHSAVANDAQHWQRPTCGVKCRNSR